MLKKLLALCGIMWHKLVFWAKNCLYQFIDGINLFITRTNSNIFKDGGVLIFNLTLLFVRLIKGVSEALS